MHGIKRVLVFCTLTTILPTMLLIIPLYLRHSFYANVAYAVTESDILEIRDGISTVFCSKHTLQMNGSFNAFQMSHKPEITSYRKHIRLKKSMNLPDDTLEYWGFYLLKGATVALSVCSRFQGASILVVKGERNLRTCGMLEHNNNKGHPAGIFVPEADRQVKITFESNAQEIISEELTSQLEDKTMHSKKQNYTSDKFVNNISNSQRDTSLEKLKKTETVYNMQNVSLTSKEIEEHLEKLFQNATTYVQKHMEYSKLNKIEEENVTRKLRHAKSRSRKLRKNHEKKDKEMKEVELVHKETNIKGVNKEEVSQNDMIEKRKHLIQALSEELNSKDDDKNFGEESKVEINDKILRNRQKRNQDLIQPPSLLDQGIRHGGNARNISDANEESSISSFENGLLNCYEGHILLAQEFEPSDQCINVSYLVGGKHMQTRHDVVEDGYYYYIFYSDNDFVSNDIHALFDIYKPTFQYENVTKSCINQTECSFSLSLTSSDRVIVEIPTKDGIDHEMDDVSLLISICHPRMGAYVIFPIAVLFLILGCAFM